MNAKTMKRGIYTLILLAAVASAAWAQGPHGTIRGKITDQQGFALPGASIYLRSEFIMGMKTFITSDTGIFQFQSLLPGTYQLTLEMPGFKTAKIDGIVIHSGQTVGLTVQMEMTTIEEEIVLDIPIPILDEEAYGASTLIDRDMLNHIPYRRDLREVVASAAGVFADPADASPARVFRGASERDSLLLKDSQVLPTPLTVATKPYPYYDTAHEIQIVTSGASAETISGGAGYVNIVSRRGGSEFQGELFLQHSNESLIADLNSPKELAEQNVTQPASSTSLWDMSLSMSGPIYGDLLRFYSQFHYVTDNQTSTFSPWTDPQETSHGDYEGRYSDLSGLFRLTGRFIKELKFTGVVSYSHSTYPTYSAVTAARIPEESTSRVDPETNLLLTGWLDYALNRRTFVDLKASYIIHDSKVLLNSEGAFKPSYMDAATGYVWGSGPANIWSKLDRFMGNASLVHFNDRILGGSQKIRIGVDYETMSTEWNTWKNDNLIIQYLNGSPYYFGEDISPASGNTVGAGRIAFSLLGKEENGLFTGAEITRLGIYAQDTISLGGRVSLNLGLRFDHTTGSINDSYKEVSANSIAYQLGEAFIEPIAYLNPYNPSQFPSWDNVIAWDFFSPRVGIVIDILGGGRTLLKASFTRSPETLRLETIAQLNAFYLGRQHEFFWFDENQDQEVNTGDSFLPFPEDYRLYNPDYYKRVTAEDLKSPYTDEFMVGIEHQFLDDLSVRLNYLYKQKENIIEDVLYSPDTDQEWYSKTKDTEGWWVPFSTEIPAAVSEYDSSPLTLYYRSRSAPPLFYRLTNVPELKRNYKGLELAVRKRMSHNWQFSGSLVYSRTSGNLGLGSLYADPFSAAANSPNYFVNRMPDSLLDYDVPLSVNLMGTYRFPYEFYLSFYYSYRRGRPWARSVTVVPPEQWAQDNGVFALPTTILSEAFGSRRYESTSNLNLRLEKDIRTGRGRIKAAVDVFNVLGSRYHWFDLNDGGFWSPVDEKTAEGIRTLSPVYGQGINLKGVREFRLSLRLFF